MRVLAFIDESGDPGRKLERGSSPYFVVAVVAFPDNQAAQECDRAIETLRGNLSLPARFEFRFARNRDHIRRRFVEAVSGFEFRYYVAIVEKSRLQPDVLRSARQLYRWTTARALELARDHLEDAIVVIDRAGNRVFRNELASSLRNSSHRGESQTRIGKIKMDRSSGNNLLQLADYIAGISARELAGDQRSGALRAILRQREGHIRLWP